MSFKPTSGLSAGTLKRIAKTHTDDVGLAKIETRGSGLTQGGLQRAAGVEAAALTRQQRKNLPGSQFVFPGKAPDSGSYPIPDREHGAKALGRAKGKPEYGAVRRAVCEKFPDLPECSA